MGQLKSMFRLNLNLLKQIRPETKDNVPPSPALQQLIAARDAYSSSLDDLMRYAVVSEVRHADVDRYVPRFDPEQKEIIARFWPQTRTNILNQYGPSVEKPASVAEDAIVHRRYEEEIYPEMLEAWQNKEYMSTFGLRAVREEAAASEIYEQALEAEAEERRLNRAADQQQRQQAAQKRKATGSARRQAVSNATLKAGGGSLKILYEGSKLFAKGSGRAARLAVKHGVPAVQKGQHYAKRNPVVSFLVVAVGGMSVYAMPLLPQAMKNTGTIVQSMTANVDAVTPGAGVQPETSGVTDALDAADHSKLLDIPDVDPHEIQGAFDILNKLSYAPGQTKKADKVKILEEYERQYRDMLAVNPDNAKVRSDLATNLKAQEDAPKPKLNDKVASLNAAAYAAIITQGRLDKSLKNKTPEESFVLLVAKARMESIFTPDIKYEKGGINAARGLCQMQPASAWDAFAPSIEKYVAPANLAPFEQIIKVRQAIYRAYAQSRLAAEYRKDPTAALAKVASSPGMAQAAFSALKDGVGYVADQKAKGGKRKVSIPHPLKLAFAETLVDNTPLYVNGQRTTRGALVNAIAALALANRARPLPQNLIARHGEDAVRYIVHQRGDGGAQQFFRDYARIEQLQGLVALQRAGKPLQPQLKQQMRLNPELWTATVKRTYTIVLKDKMGRPAKDKKGKIRKENRVRLEQHQRTPQEALNAALAIYRGHSWGQAQSNKGIWLSGGAMKSPGTVMHTIAKDYFGKFVTAAQTLAPAMVTPEKGRQLVFSRQPGGTQQSAGLHLETVRKGNKLAAGNLDVPSKAVRPQMTAGAGRVDGFDPVNKPDKSCVNKANLLPLNPVILIQNQRV